MAQKEKIKVFENNPIPSGNIFKFIDSLFNKDRVGTYKELTSLAKDDVDNFYIFSMILYGLRNLIHADIKSVKFQQMQSFQQTKLSQQTKKFGESKLKNLLEELYLLDKRVKTGEIDADLMITIAIEKVLC
ncbi:hypothetical protein A2264_03720 [candidate division WWE3 bacterium RIFOXYA2_FULL_46_9]|uniref:DNA polymerase III delta subunit-like C-terminal domain-containing protein n=1 Tax=candidate division WWE3 bacterium RIFOXYA2_FULL_46_9 TaxID=1802636 RepID=A0A1F4W0S9_UNCKA|nr:MAG: hypothetical protein A2264_03720 [candidate division WWE3 bacterium RIFOXYA2_FULL_46_9]